MKRGKSRQIAQNCKWSKVKKTSRWIMSNGIEIMVEQKKNQQNYDKTAAMKW